MGFFLDLVANLLAAWVADLLTPYGMTGVAIGLAVTVVLAANWHRRQRKVGKLGMASWPFIAFCFVIAAVAIAGGAFGLGLRFAGDQKKAEAPAVQNEDGPIDLYTGKKISGPAAHPYPNSILGSRYYSAKNKEDVADILDMTANALNNQGRDIFDMAEAAINRSPWDRPNEDLTPMINRLQRIEAETANFRRDLFETLYQKYPDYRKELNNLLFPADAPANFEGGTKNFYNALIVWKEHRDGLDGPQRQEFVALINTARSAFGGFRQEFLKWESDREQKINQTRLALRQ